MAIGQQAGQSVKWGCVVGCGPTSNQHLANVLCLLGERVQSPLPKTVQITFLNFKDHFLKMTQFHISYFSEFAESFFRANYATELWGGGPRLVVNTAAFHARVRGSFPGHGGLKETKMFLPHPLVKLSIVGSLRDRELL